jgi:hypothetical protein
VQKIRVSADQVSNINSLGMVEVKLGEGRVMSAVLERKRGNLQALLSLQ